MTNMMLQSYLKFGYDSSFSDFKYLFDFSKIDKVQYENVAFNDLVSLGSRILLQSLESIYQKGRDYVVPISGGVDSRILLAFMLKHHSPKDIKTYTFGVPKTYDFDIGNNLAKALKTNHISFDFHKHVYTLDELIETSKRMSHQSPMFFHPPLFELEKHYKNHIFFSGVNAGAVVGSFVPKSDSATIEEAKVKFVKKEIFKKKLKLHHVDDNKFIDDIKFNPIDQKMLSFDEQVTINERSLKYLAPHVLLSGFDYQLPFINTPFMDFMLSVPNEFRSGKKLYKAIALNLFPELFLFPLEGDYGLKLNKSKKITQLLQKYVKLRIRLYDKYPKYLNYLSPMTNYFDLNHAFRHNQNIKSIVFEQLQDLKKRNLLDNNLIDAIWQDHQNYKMNYATEINFLFSIEIHIKAGKSI